ncbi:MAG: hypothetical protein IJC17_03060 [Clostridia bacterium]|nr:hypothetical protein [Clostridia bacterium]
MVNVKVRAFLIALVASLCLFGAIAVWLIPSPPPAPTEPVASPWQAEDAVYLRLTFQDEADAVSCVVRFDPARCAITVSGDASFDREASFTRAGVEALLAEWGNDLPLMLLTPVDVDTPTAHLHLDAGHHLLAAEQAGILLAEDPTLWPEVIVSAINAYRTRSPQSLFEGVVRHATATDLSIEDFVRAHDALVYLWDANTGHLCRRQSLE